MALNAQEEKELETLKATNKMSFEIVRHKHRMEELAEELEIAKVYSLPAEGVVYGRKASTEENE